MTLARLAVLAVLAVLAAAGCSSKRSQPEDRAPPTSGSDREHKPEPARSAEPPRAAPTEAAAAVAPPADFPPECVAYAELINKLKTCDRLGAARDGLAESYHNIQSSWSAVPTDRRPEVAQQCKTQADSLRNAAAATCGW